MRRLLRESLVQFLLVGAALFAASTFTSGRDIRRDDRIVVGAGQVEHLAARFTRTWRRPPTVEELEGLVNDYVREEAAYREGVALGLDQDDSIIRRRIRQKLDFIAADVAVAAAPTERELEDYLASHAEDYRVPSRYTFLQVYLDPGRRRERLEPDARELLGRLRRDPALDVRELGDPTLIGVALEDVSTREIAGLFGEDFAAAMEALDWPTAESGPRAPGRWYGPIPSGYGLHLVRTDAREEGRLPALAEVADAVRRDWESARETELKEKFYTDLLDRYEVSIEWPGVEIPEKSP